MLDHELQPDATFEYSNERADEAPSRKRKRSSNDACGDAARVSPVVVPSGLIPAALEEIVVEEWFATETADDVAVEQGEAFQDVPLDFPGSTSFSEPGANASYGTSLFDDSNAKETRHETETSEAEKDDAERDEDDEGESGGRAVAPVAAPLFGVTASGTMRYAEFEGLFREWRKSGDPRLRDRLILMNRGLVAFLARRFAERGEMSEDLMQQGLIGLINALDSFDPDRGTRFVTFATPTILGEMRRYLRDRTWGVRVPRRLHELNHIINQRVDALTQQLDRSPTYSEIARSLGLELEEVIEALELFNTAEPVSFDEAETAHGENNSPISERLGALDTDLESMNDYAALRTALEQLEPRERQVVELVYFQGHSQLGAAKQLKVSQMNVSRLQRRALERLRELMNSSDL